MPEQPWVRRRRQAEKRTPCDLDGSVYNLASAWLGPPSDLFPSGWRALKHGCGPVDAMKACACPLCWDRIQRLEYRPEPPPPKPPRAVAVEPVAEHVRQLLADGMSRGEIAIAAGVDRTTIIRVLRGDVARVYASTAERLFAVTPVLHPTLHPTARVAAPHLVRKCL